MPLEVRRESEVFCLDFTREAQHDFVPYEITLPEVICKKCGTGGQAERLAMVFDSENLALTYGRVKTEMEQLAAGFIASGLKQSDRVLICGFNHSQVVVAALAAARAGLVFSLASPNFSHPDQLRHLLQLGEFHALVLFSSTGGGSDRAYQLVSAVCPEVRISHCGQTKSKALPKLTHIILADEDHRHAGTYTLSELCGKSSKERIEKLPAYSQWNSHKLAAIQFTQGASGPPKAVGLSHYQLVNGCRIAAHAIGIRHDTVLSCALPLYRLPVFCLAVLTPFLLEAKSVVPEPSPVPKFLFSSINKYLCTHVISNAAAMRLLLKMALNVQKVSLPTVQTVILLGERVSAELLTSVERVMCNAKRIAVGMLCTELGAIPLLSDNTTNLVKSVGKPLDGYEVDVVKIDKLQLKFQHQKDEPATVPAVGELRIRALAKTKFIGYGPKFADLGEWIPTGDIATVNSDGNVELIAHKEDLVYDRYDKLVEHWRMERVMAQATDDLRGVQVVQTGHGAPIVAVLLAKKPLLRGGTHGGEVVLDLDTRKELSAACRDENLPMPDQFAVVADFPRVNTRIQKFKLREWLRNSALKTY